MITKKEVISIFRRYFPEPTWGVWFTNAGILSQFKTLGVKTVVPIDGEVYGQAFQIMGSRPTKYEWGWVSTRESWEDDDYDDIPHPPDRTGKPGEIATITREIQDSWEWKEVPVEFERFNLLDELSADDFEKMANKMADELRANGIEW